MPRSLTVPLALAALALLLAAPGAPAGAQPASPPPGGGDAKHRVEDLEPALQKALVEAARTYLDPAVEFLWRPRKDLLALFATLPQKAGIEPLRDVEFLRSLAYQGRHYLDDFGDKKWQKENTAEYRKEANLYNNVVSEGWRFTWTLPSTYPKPDAIKKIPRPPPLPLLISIHEEPDTKDAKGAAEKYPGMAVLARRFPKEEFSALYEGWMTLAPVAARAKFLEDDGLIRHAYLTAVVTDFWRRYHVDFDRVVLDGTEPAAALASSYPHVFAGLVLRGGKVDVRTVPNYSAVPVFVVKDEALAKTLRDAGHPDVTVGDGKDVVVWMNQRRRSKPSAFRWTEVSGDQRYSQWIVIDSADFTQPERTLRVQVLDTEADPNTIRVDAKGIEQVSIFLNDEVIDLGKDVRLVLNGQETLVGKLERTFDQLFFREPQVRKNMNFGWLFPAVLPAVRLPPPSATPAEAPAPAPTEVKGTEEKEKQAQELWEKALAAEAAGQADRAETYYQQVVDVGETSFKAKAEEKLKALQKGGNGEGGGGEGGGGEGGGGG